MTQLITFSGTVGTGKTHSAKWIRDMLIDAGYNVYYLRFRFISLGSFFNKKKLEKTHEHALKVKKKKIGSRTRFREFIPERIGYLRMAGYFFRALRLKALLMVRYRNDVVILDRFIYDNLTQFQLEDGRQIKRASRLAGWFPQPQCSFIMDADIATLLSRRKFHSEHYLIHVLENYRCLAENLDHVCLIRTDDLASINDQLLNKIKLKFSLNGVKEV